MIINNKFWTWGIVFIFIFGIVSTSPAANRSITASQQGPIVSKGNSTWTKPNTKVLLEVFMDFYCPHCHDFEMHVLPQITQAFGSSIEIRQIGFPVVQGQTRDAFELYEAVKAEGKGSEMAKELFQVLHDERSSLRKPSVKAGLLKAVGLDSTIIENHIHSGKAAISIQKEIVRAQQYGITSTPIVVVNHTYLVSDTSAENLGAIIQHLLMKNSDTRLNNKSSDAGL